MGIGLNTQQTREKNMNKKNKIRHNLNPLGGSIFSANTGSVLDVI
jgi:hypothetical protein